MQEPQWSEKNKPVSNRELLTLLTILIAVILILFWLFNLLLNNLINFIPVSVEQKLGSIIVPLYQEKAQPSPQQNTLNTLLDKLEQKLDNQGRNYQVFYLPEDTVNAVAIPGDTILIYQGILKEIESENELMMILGHELGHFHNRDHLRGIGRQLIFPLILSYFTGDSTILQGAIVTISQSIGNAQFSQSQEKLADKFGLELLEKYYHHVAGATDFFERISHKRDTQFDILATHPNPAKRVKILNDIIRKNHYKIDSKTPLPPVLKLR